MTTPLQPFTRCLEPGCDWQPDPGRRMAPENQTDEHGDQAGHAVAYGMERKEADDEQLRTSDT